ncbi:toluene tolerance protein [Alphaproteobacteria bacterium]|nr:toluene tolerance protein [Alphaproteobacteria bacterium]
MLNRLILIAFMACASFSSARAAETADAFVDRLTAEVISQVVEAKTSQTAKTQALKGLFDKYGDMPYVAKFVLGRYWKPLDEPARAAFTEVFTTALSATWARRFTEFSGSANSYVFKHEGTETGSSGDEMFVSTLAVPSDNSSAGTKIVWRLRSVGGALKLVDLVVEGISMAMTYRNEFAGILSRSGGDVKTLDDALRSGILSQSAGGK